MYLSPFSFRPRSALAAFQLRRHRSFEPIAATVRRVDEELGFVEQIAARFQGVKLTGLATGVEQVIGKLAPGKRIKEFLRIVVAGAKFRDNAVRIIRDIWILEFDQSFRRTQHGAKSALPGL